MLNADMQLVTVYGAISPRSCPASYKGITWLADKGESLVTVLLPYEVKRFPRLSYTIKVPVDSTFVEYHDNDRPVLIVNHWEPFYD